MWGIVSLWKFLDFSEPKNPILHDATEATGKEAGGKEKVQSKCPSCETSEKKANDTQKELIGNILESNKTKEDLRKVITTKDDFIKQLENKLKKSEGDKKRREDRVQGREEQCEMYICLENS